MTNQEKYQHWLQSCPFKYHEDFTDDYDGFAVAVVGFTIPDDEEVLPHE